MPIPEFSAYGLIVLAFGIRRTAVRDERRRCTYSTASCVYELVWWIPAETAAAIPAAFGRLAVELDLLPAAPTEQAADQQAIVRDVLDALRHRSGWLLVFDHADPATVTPHLPSAGGHVLVTSRNPHWHHRVRSPLQIETLDPQDAVQFLLVRTASQDAANAAALAERLGWLPLALAQAAAFMSRSRMPIATYLSLYERRSLDLLSQGAPDDYPHPVGVTMKLAIDQLAASPAARDLLTWCAFMAPENIPLFVLVGGSQVEQPDALGAMLADEIELEKTIAALLELSLVARHDSVLDVHRLVQAVVRSRLEAPERAAWAERAVLLLLEAFPSSIEELGSPRNGRAARNCCRTSTPLRTRPMRSRRRARSARPC